MDQPARAQIRLILDNLDDLARKTVMERLRALYADHAARGLLQSGATVKVGVRLMEEEAGRLAEGAVDQVAAVAKDIEAFAMIEAMVKGFDTFLLGQLDDVVAKASGRMVAAASDSVSRAAQSLYNEAQRRWTRQLGVHRFTFTEIFRLAEHAKVAPDASASPKNKGGKPLAAHWDGMWADIAFQLWNGDLQPTKQGDISKAMFAWLTAKGIDAGHTAVTDRARTIWQKIEAKRLS